MPDPQWAVRFETDAKDMMITGEYKPLIDYETLGPEALLSIPTPDHYLPCFTSSPQDNRVRSSLSQSKVSTVDRYPC